MKYFVSPDVEITAIDKTATKQLPALYRKGYVLHDQAKDCEYFINPTIKYFLEKFSEAQTIDEVISSVKADVKSDDEKVAATCNEFTQFLIRRKILVKEGTEKTKVISESFLNKGDTIDDWYIEDVLSLRSNMDIYKAIHKTIGQCCVLKLINRKKIKTEYQYTVALAELHREYLLLQQTLAIPGVYDVYEFCKKKDIAYMTLEYVNGKSLNSFLRQAGKLSLADTLEIISSILQPFALLHQQKMIHGDIHSSNVLITQNREVKIIDLGFSRIAEIEKDQLIKHGGVNQYMPPERINISSFKKYAKAPELSSDVYQIGLLMYVALYNKMPFDGFVWEELANNIKYGKAVFAARSCHGYKAPQWLMEIVKKCLDKVPENRYGSAILIFEAFKHYEAAMQANALNK